MRVRTWFGHTLATMRHRVIQVDSLRPAAGELMAGDASVADGLEAGLRNLSLELGESMPPGHGVILDFTDIDYLNSSHLAQLLRIRKKLTDRGSKLLLCSMSDQLWSMIHLTGLDRVFKIASSARDAMGMLAVEEQGGG